jgi:hypothetical protein
MKIKYGGLHRKLRESNNTSINSFNEFINIIGVNRELSNAILFIGISYSYTKNLNREIQDLHPDFCWTEDSTNSEYSNAKNSPKNQWYQLFFPFTINPIYRTGDFFIPLIAKDFDEESNKIEQVYEYFKENCILNKFSLIVFDSSTSKFLFPNSEIFVTFPSFISYLFYYFLEINGELFVSLKNISHQTPFIYPNNAKELDLLKRIIENRTHINNMKQTDEIFGQKFIYVVYNHLLKKKNGSTVDRIRIIRLHPSSTEEYIMPEINKEIVQENNIEYLRRNLLGSQIQYSPNGEETKEEKENHKIYHQTEYPIKKTNYPIGPFIKITKMNNLRFDRNNLEDFQRIFSVIYNDLIVHKMNPEILQKDLDGLNCLFI